MQHLFLPLLQWLRGESALRIIFAPQKKLLAPGKLGCDNACVQGEARNVIRGVVGKSCWLFLKTIKEKNIRVINVEPCRLIKCMKTAFFFIVVHISTLIMKLMIHFENLFSQFQQFRINFPISADPAWTQFTNSRKTPVCYQVW